MTITLLFGLALGAAPPAAPSAAPADAPTAVPTATTTVPATTTAPAVDGSSAPADRPPPSTWDRLQQDGAEPSDEREISWSGQLLKTVLGLGVVVGLIYLLFRLGLARYLGGAALRGTGKNLRVVERTQLDARHALLIVEVEGHRLLLATGEKGVQHLADLTAPTSASGPSFAQTLLKTASSRPTVTESSPGDTDGNQNR